MRADPTRRRRRAPSCAGCRRPAAASTGRRGRGRRLRPETRAALSASERAALDRLTAELPRRLDAVAECGLPTTLVHGDLHPGNWRRHGDQLTLLDWGDVGVGTPVLDVRAFVERLDGPALRARVRDRWADAWRRRVPGSDPARAVALVAPVAQLAAAAAYQRFLDSIEVTERVYHADDPVHRLREAIAVDRVGP
jgi:Ser/Thr protein kinase RdoA (MazF antagonist)